MTLTGQLSGCVSFIGKSYAFTISVIHFITISIIHKDHPQKLSSDPESHPKVGFESVSGFGFRVSGFGFRSVLGKVSLQSRFRVSGFGFRWSKLQTSLRITSPKIQKNGSSICPFLKLPTCSIHHRVHGSENLSARYR